MKKILFIALSGIMISAFTYAQDKTATQSTDKKSQVSTATQDKTTQTNTAVQDKTKPQTGTSAQTPVQDRQTGTSQSTSGTGASGAVNSGIKAGNNERGKDLEFVNEAASGGLMEVELGKLAQQKGSSQAVKDFGKMMVTDHSAANNKLKVAIEKLGVPMPTKMMDKHQNMVDGLNKKSGSDFDKAYVDMMVKDHKEDVAKFEKEQNDGNDPALKQWASSTLPALKKHQSEAIKLQNQLK